MAGRTGRDRSAGLLTERQVEILELRSRHRTQEEVAGILGISRQNVSILERRAMRNIRTAADTLEAAENIGLLHRIRLSRGIHILDAAKQIIEFADRAGVKVGSSSMGIMTLIRDAATSHMENGVLGGSLEVMLFPDGRITVSRPE